MDGKKQLKRWIKVAKATPGWNVEATKNGHWKFFPPEGQIIVVGGTPSDHRAVKNAAASLRRAGLDA